jgi:hypothetical protein
VKIGVKKRYGEGESEVEEIEGVEKIEGLNKSAGGH